MKVVRVLGVAVLVSTVVGAGLAAAAIIAIHVAEVRDQRKAVNRAFQPRPYGSMK